MSQRVLSKELTWDATATSYCTILEMMFHLEASEGNRFVFNSVNNLLLNVENL